MAYYRRRPAPVRGEGRRGRPGLSARRDLPRAGRALRRLPLGRGLHGAPAQGRRPLAGGLDRVAPAPGAEGAGHLHPPRPGRRHASARSAPRRHASGDARARAPAGPPPGRGRGRPAHPLRADRAEPAQGRNARAESRAARAAGAAPGRSVLRHRGRSRTRSTTGSTTSSASSSPACRTPNGKPTFHAFWARDAEGKVTRAAEKRAFERAHGSLHGSARQGSEHPHLPLRAVRADRPRPAHGPARDPRGRGGPAAPRRRARRSLRSRPPGRARVGRELLDQAARAPLPVHARDRPARRRSRDRRLRGLAAGGRRSRPRRRGPAEDRALQPRRRRVDAAPARLARRPSAGARGADRRALPRPQPQVGRGHRGSLRDARARAGARGSPDRRRSRRREGAHPGAARAAGCWPSSCPGTAARRRRSGGGTSS